MRAIAIEQVVAVGTVSVPIDNAHVLVARSGVGDGLVGRANPRLRAYEIELRIISSLFVKCSEFQNDICDIIKSNTSTIFNLPYVPHLKRMYNANVGLMTVTLNYLEENKRIDKKNIKLILESNSKIAFSVERK